MAWKIEYSRTASEQLRELDKQTAKKMLDYGDELAKQDDPRSLGTAMIGPMGTFWSFRLEDKSLFCDIQDTDCRIVVLRLIE